MSGPYETSLGSWAKSLPDPIRPKLRSGSPDTNSPVSGAKEYAVQPSMPMTTVGQGIGNSMQGVLKLLQQRQQINGAGGGLSTFGQGGLFGTSLGGPAGGLGSVATPGGMNQTQALATGNQIGPANPTPDQQAAANADVGNESAMASSMPSGAQNSPMTQQAQGMGGRRSGRRKCSRRSPFRDRQLFHPASPTGREYREEPRADDQTPTS